MVDAHVVLHCVVVIVFQVDVTDTNTPMPSRDLNTSILSNGGASVGVGSGRLPGVKSPVTVAKIDVSNEGAVQVVRHFNDGIHSPLLFATSGGGLHNFDLRARRHGWRIPIPPQLGYATAMEIVPGLGSCAFDHDMIALLFMFVGVVCLVAWCLGGLAVVVGTNRGMIAVYDMRFRLLVSVWRHSHRSPIQSLFPYLTHTPSGKQLACIIATGEDEVCAWNLETGEAIVLLRNLPDSITDYAARRPPFLTRVPTRGEVHFYPLS